MRPPAVVAACLLLAVAQIPNGAYGMPELCTKLKSATGVFYKVDPDLVDYPVFVSTKNGDPERVKQLVADALRAKWVKDGDRFRLESVKYDPSTEFAAFEVQFKKAAAGKPALEGVDIKEVFQMPAGRLLRFGTPSNDIFHPFPSAFQKKIESSPGGPWYVYIRRFSEGAFETRVNLPSVKAGVFSSDSDVMFADLPKDVATSLRDDLAKTAVDKDRMAALTKMTQTPGAIKIDWTDLDKRDPVAAMTEPLLSGLAKAVHVDIALALPDSSFLALGGGGPIGDTVQVVLGHFAAVDELEMKDEALVGKIPTCDRFTPAQTRRDVLGKLVATIGKTGVANVDALAGYVRDQRPAASDSWMDAMMLIVAGLVVDQEYVGDYPYNLRLYTALDKNDWSLVRSGKPFLAADLSPDAKKELFDVLLQSRNRMEDQGSGDAAVSILGPRTSDPALWPSLDPRSLSIAAALTNESVLIGWTSINPDVENVDSSAIMHDDRMKLLGHEPLYQPAVRQKLKLVIDSTISHDSVDTGFSIVIPDAKAKPSTWDQLPADIAKAFKASLDSMRRRPPVQQQGVPPPRKR
ncbi:MAG TPA: hypothetical protein VMI31_05855 [Fimbriimonadaceae bacterium]|nr:hypothetical protein [Fimbriimonadaceae bacterium]